MLSLFLGASFADGTLQEEHPATTLAAGYGFLLSDVRMDLIRFRWFSADCDCSSVDSLSMSHWKFLEILLELDDLDDYCEVRAFYMNL